MPYQAVHIDADSRKTHKQVKCTSNQDYKHSIKSLRLQPAATILAVGRLANRRVTSKANEPALNEHVAKINYTHERN